MILNYIKLALRVMARRKFFTFITLFGISFTLMVLMLIVSYLNTEFSPVAPLSQIDKLVVMPSITIKKEYFDTIPQYDTSMVSGIMKIDTSQKIEQHGQNNSTSSLSRRIIESYFMKLPSAEFITYHTSDNSFDIFQNNQKLSINVSYIGPNFWNVFDFQLLKGRYIDANDNLQSKTTIVITDKVAKEFFSSNESALGKTLDFDEKEFEVVGVVKSPHSDNRLLRADVFVSESLHSEGTDNYYFGNFAISAIGNPELIKKDIVFASTKIPMEDVENYDKIKVVPMTYKEFFAMQTQISETPEKALKYILFLLGGIISFFTLLPLLNLINLNVSRIMDRSSEIGVRKAFGATDSNIMYQYIFENIIQTFIGGIFGLLLAFICIYYINESNFFGSVELQISTRFFFYSFVATLIFGILSGLIPAYIISRSHIVSSLKSNQL